MIKQCAFNDCAFGAKPLLDYVNARVTNYIFIIRFSRRGKLNNSELKLQKTDVVIEIIHERKISSRGFSPQRRKKSVIDVRR